MGANFSTAHASERDAPSAAATARPAAPSTSLSRLQSRLATTEQQQAQQAAFASKPAATAAIAAAAVPDASPAASAPQASALALTAADAAEQTERRLKSGVPLLVPAVPTDAASLAAAPAWHAQPVQHVPRAGQNFPDETEFLEMRAGDVPAVTVPASRLPKGYTFESDACPPLAAPLNDDEALLFFVYERWRSNWWHINAPFGALAWQLPFDPMASPWNWDRQTMTSGALVALGSLLDYVQRGGLPRFAAHMCMTAAFPLTASKIHQPEHRDMGFLASAALNAAVGGYGAFQFFSRPKRPVPWAFFCMFIHTLPSAALHVGRYFEFTKAQKFLNPAMARHPATPWTPPAADAPPLVRPLIRVYNAHLLPQYFQHQQRERARAQQSLRKPLK